MERLVLMGRTKWIRALYIMYIICFAVMLAGRLYVHSVQIYGDLFYTFEEYGAEHIEMENRAYEIVGIINDIYVWGARTVLALMLVTLTAVPIRHVVVAFAATFGAVLVVAGISMIIDLEWWKNHLDHVWVPAIDVIRMFLLYIVADAALLLWKKVRASLTTGRLAAAFTVLLGTLTAMAVVFDIFGDEWSANPLYRPTQNERYMLLLLVACLTVDAAVMLVRKKMQKPLNG